MLALSTPFRIDLFTVILKFNALKPAGVKKILKQNNKQTNLGVENHETTY
jgi:hypothetical protein